MEDDRLTIREAALRMGVSEGAIRKRVERGTLRSEKGADGRVYVFLDAGLDDRIDASIPHASNALTSALEDRIASLERQLKEANERDRENRRIIAALTQRIPELEAPSPTERPPDGPEAAATGSEGAEPRSSTAGPQRPAERRSWWREFFGFGDQG